MSIQTFLITGMTCEACTKLTAKRIKTIKGVNDVVVTLTDQTAMVTSARPINFAEVATVLDGTHYQVKEA
ncbi:hypothetical protein BH09PAT4_BH09PAT4_00110 [soil metagenome]